MPSFLEQLLGLLPATSGGYMMNQGHTLRRDPTFTPAADDMSWAWRMPASVQKSAARAIEDMPESENVEDRRLSDKTLKGYRGIIDAFDREGFTQYPAGKAFARRPTAAEMRLLRASGEKPVKAAEGAEESPLRPEPPDLQQVMDLIRSWREQKK